MPRGAKVDKEATRLARCGKLPSKAWEGWEVLGPARLMDRRSFVTTTGHLRLYGRDMAHLRSAVWSERKTCAVCGCLTKFHAHMVDPLRAELAHVLSRGRGGCDCRHNVQIKCRRHHRGPEGEHP